MPEPERKQHPVVAGLVALLGVGLAIGLLAGGGTLLATRVLGLGAEATAVDSDGPADDVPAQAGEDHPDRLTVARRPTLTAASEPTGPVPRPPAPRPRSP